MPPHSFFFIVSRKTSPPEKDEGKMKKEEFDGTIRQTENGWLITKSLPAIG
jgi:hypothetical protein